MIGCSISETMMFENMQMSGREDFLDNLLNFSKK